MNNRHDGVAVGYAAIIAEDRVAYDRRVRHRTLQHTLRRHGGEEGEQPQL